MAHDCFYCSSYSWRYRETEYPEGRREKGIETISDRNCAQTEPKYVCFECRKVWGTKYEHMPQYGRKGWDEWDRKRDGIPRCGGCGKPGHHMGRDFRAPKRKDDVAWKIVERFVKSGEEEVRAINPKAYILRGVGRRNYLTMNDYMLASIYFDHCECPRGEAKPMFPKKMKDFDSFIRELSDL